MTESELIAGIVAREGATYTNRPADQGGPTKYGITLATLRRIRGATITADDVAALTLGEAVAVYRDEYLPPWAWVPDEGVRVILIDWGVTSSREAVVRGLQAAVGATIDGVLGQHTKTATIAACEAADAVRVALRHQRADYYCHLALDQPSVRQFLDSQPAAQLHNLRGWIRRATEV